MTHRKTPTDGDDELRVVSVRNAMKLLNMSRSTLYRRLRDGDLESFADGGMRDGKYAGRRKIKLSSIKQYLASRIEETSLREAKQLLRDASAERPSDNGLARPCDA